LTSACNRTNKEQKMAIQIRPEIKAIASEIIDIRRDIHMYPEQGFDVYRTAALVAENLRKLGIHVQEKVGKTGVVGDLEGNHPGPTIALRADMDALPIQETGNVVYRSKNDGVMHACGHDGHTAILLGAARVLSAKRNLLHGRLRFIFQPSEEKDGGATHMIDDGCLEGVDEIYGIHLWNYSEFGEIGCKPGAIMAATDSLNFIVEGIGGHGAMPQGTVDAIVVSANLINALQTVVSRNIDPLKNAVVTVGTIHGGDNHNVIASSVKMDGTVRTFSEEISMLIRKRIRQIATGMENTFGGKVEVKIEKGYPATVNDPRLFEKLMTAAKSVVGDCARKTTPFMGGEDFAYYAKKVPGCFFFIGSSPRGVSPGTIPHHCSHFDFDERALLVGASVLLELVENSLVPGKNVT
jgi:amidohydrolase